ncbi:dihydroorotate dehydrogenase electron transfer subunit [Hydrogenispora sp. UU3]|uniref:Dihydroorotate dehydrogenase electron transfer subunit n=1 Tax=Capillibacterium thermochitinicola TaxID=2699427 RepID=A0A8J6HZS7_9FIRM|nr:dihydroorotate dehydrogenase electron transfer subunit [Capillibacterium thermochitinicola]MBA2132144.1 dihydroorotate dehydrogenase electron transfer subunit [Capillibacterium thermochitinicola]
MLHRETVLENRSLGSAIYRLVLKGAVAATARPGQFVHVQVGTATDPLLRRPFSIAGIDRPKGEVTIYYRVTGRGTALLTRVRAGETLSVIGPVGKGFTVPAAGELLLVAGGIGLFPLLALLAAVDRLAVRVKVLWGGENRRFLEDVGRATLFQMGVDYAVATVDGSMGHPGLVTDLLQAALAPETAAGQQAESAPSGGQAGALVKSPEGRTAITVAACGPKGMLQAVAACCGRAGVPVEVSLEERMACGIGACLGCACLVRTAEGTPVRRRVCKDGPVFDGREVVWDETG